MKSLRLVGVVAFAVLVGGCESAPDSVRNPSPGWNKISVSYAHGSARPVLTVDPNLWAVDGTLADWQRVVSGNLKFVSGSSLASGKSGDQLVATEPGMIVVQERGDQCRLVINTSRPMGTGLESYACGWPEGAAQDYATVLIVERRVAIALREDSDAARVSARFGLPVVATTGPRGYVLDTGPDPLGALLASLRLAADPAVASANPIIRYPRSVRSAGR